MGSASASVNATGIGIGFGKTYTDDNCVMLKNSREMWNYGMKAAALQLMCADPANRKAIRETYVPGGFLCHGDTPPETPEQKQAALAQQQADLAAKQAREKQLRIAAAQATAAAQKAALAAKEASDAATAAAAQATQATQQAEQANAQLANGAAPQETTGSTTTAELSRDSHTVSDTWPGGNAH